MREPEVMNDLSATTNGMHTYEGPRSRVQWLPAAAGANTVSEGATLLRRVGVLLILVIFSCQFTIVTVTRFARVPDESWDVVLPRVLVTICGVLISLINLRIQGRIKGASIWKRAGIAAGLGLIGSYLHAAANMLIFSIFIGYGVSSSGQYVVAYLFAGLDWLWLYLAISMVILALTYAADLRESEDRIAAFRSQAQAAQLEALRYQLNPHFLFNTLNSIAALIGRENPRDAEAMVISLSDFLRSTLMLDPAKQITLGQEIELQSLYLEIEKVRFPARLHVTIDVPEKLSDALVPNLISQPLVENAIKYSVARSSERVELAIVAREVDGSLSVKVEDDGGNAIGPPAKGTGVGLRNISDRLRLHFGEAASLIARPRESGGFTAEILMPLKRS